MRLFTKEIDILIHVLDRLLIVQHTISIGMSLNLTDAKSMSLGYAYGFKYSINGTKNRIPNLIVRLEASSHSLLSNLQIKFESMLGRKATGVMACESFSQAEKCPTRWLLLPAVR